MGTSGKVARTFLVAWGSLLSASCAWHWPGSKEADRRPFTSGHERESVHPFEMAINAVGSLGLTLLIHEGAHALAADMMGGDNIEVSFFAHGRVGETTFDGDLSDGDLNFVDVAGAGATYLTGEILEWGLAREVVPDRLRPFIATWALTNKFDLYLQTVQSVTRDGSDFDDIADRSDFPRGGFFAVAGVDLWFHQDTYLDLFREATTHRKATTPDDKSP